MGDPSCTACGAAQCSSENQVTILQGYPKTFTLELRLEDCTGSPFDLTGMTQILAVFPGTDGTPVQLTYTASGGVTVVGAAGAGKIQVAVSAAKSLLMAVNPNGTQTQDLQIVVTIATVKTPFLFFGVLNIVAPPYGVL